MSSQIYIQIVNLDRLVLEEMKAFVGVGRIYMKPLYSERHRQTYVWVLASRQALKLIHLIVPHVIVKKQQLELALQFQETIRKVGGHYRLAAGVIDLRKSIASKISEANKGGVRKLAAVES